MSSPSARRSDDDGSDDRSPREMRVNAITHHASVSEQTRVADEGD